MILVTGGAGYIGSHVALELLLSGYDVVILDNLSTGHRDTVNNIELIKRGCEQVGDLHFVVGDTGDKKQLIKVIRDNPIRAIVHLAAFSQVGESMLNPGKYFENNVARAINILECMVQGHIEYIVFSSTAAVYGEPQAIPIIEEHPTQPTNVYGASKLMVEELLRWYEQVHGIRHVALRYFNAAGADRSGLIGERHEPETHLIPLVIQKVMGKRPGLTVFGSDYPTPDGTCVRDYIHVSDLAQAHILALEALFKGMDSRLYNLGNGNGYTVKEVIDTVGQVTGQEVGYELGARRAGDPAILVASSEKIQAELGWKPHFPALNEIVASAWKWHNLPGRK
ncbi:MAG: UDP-glucose 4-epimerase GalE [Syntrophomonadaceae bacterium]